MLAHYLHAARLDALLRETGYRCFGVAHGGVRFAKEAKSFSQICRRFEAVKDRIPCRKRSRWNPRVMANFADDRAAISRPLQQANVIVRW